MDSDDERCIFIDVQRNDHVYQKSDENDFVKILYARRGHLYRQAMDLFKWNTCMIYSIHE